MRTLPENNLASSVKLDIVGNGSGSGFLLCSDDLIFLVTAKHVIYKKFERNELVLAGEELVITAKDKDHAVVKPTKIKINMGTVKIFTSDIVDLALIPLGRKINALVDKFQISFLPGISTSEEKYNLVIVNTVDLLTYDEVLISNDVFTLGYPTSIGIKDSPQIDYDQPLLRKGIVAGKNDRIKSIILDCPVYQGNSGGLVMQVDPQGNQTRFQIIGIVTEFIPFFEVMYSLHHHYTNQNLENSGYSVVVPSDHIFDVIKKFKSQIH